MVLCSNLASGGIIAYNGDSARGWNDPPTFAFSNNMTGNRPKLDLRKRVSHQQALHGVQTPSSNLQPAVVNNDEITNGVGALKLNGVSQPLYTEPPVTTNASLRGNNLNGIAQPLFTPPVTTNPPLGSNNLNGVTQPLFTPAPVTTTSPLVNCNLMAPSIPTMFTRSVSTPSFTDAGTASSSDASVNLTQSINPPGAHASAKSTENLSGNLGQPLFALKDHSFEPIRTAPLHSIRSTAEISDHFDDHHSSPQIFHPATPPVTKATAMPSYQDNPLLTQPSIPPLGHVTPPPSLPSQPPVGHTTPPLYHRQSPVPGTKLPQGNGVAVHPPMGHSGTPPPLPGNHISPSASLSAGSTPRSMSPSGEEKNVVTSSSVDDQEGLKITMDALQDVINKLQDNLEKRVADDIARRLQVMRQNWKNGKLSQGVKSRMIKLAQALDAGNVEEAHQIHISLMVDFVSEVNQWMVAVKKLINLVHTSSTFPAHS